MAIPYKIFIVEDDPWYGEILKYHLSLNPDHQVSLFLTGKECIDNLQQFPDLITLDFSLPDIKGDELFKKIKRIHPDVPVIVISGQEKITTAVDLLKMGVTDYLIKDENTKDLVWNSINKIKETLHLKKEVQELRAQLQEKYNFNNLIKGTSPAMQKLFVLMEKAAISSINVSITGETGTGKELVAQAIHFNSLRQRKPFIAVNMAAIPKELIESELFGHEKGSFTGAYNTKIGKFEEANQGTLFLDEIGELDLSVQSKLLRVLQERVLQRVGGNQNIKLDVRIIVATHQNLSDAVSKGCFREDLYYRIMGLPISLPPLRERGNDILFLAKHFIEQFCKENRMSSVTISPEAKDKLIGYNYPGNVRELRTIMELAAVMCNGKNLLPDDITFAPAGKEENFLTHEKTLKDYTRNIVAHFLKKYDNNVLLVAKKLDVGKSSIYNMIKEYER